LKGFRWGGKTQGQETVVNKQNCYVTGNSPGVAIIVIHDLYGWTFPNTRLLADSYAAEVGATVYVPDL
jgi:dienelactone hydrolase